MNVSDSGSLYLYVHSDHLQNAPSGFAQCTRRYMAATEIFIRKITTLGSGSSCNLCSQIKPPSDCRSGFTACRFRCRRRAQNHRISTAAIICLCILFCNRLAVTVVIVLVLGAFFLRHNSTSWECFCFLLRSGVLF